MDSTNGNRRGVRGRSGAYGGDTLQPGDEQTGTSSREERELMDQKFREAFERTLRQNRGDERR